LHVNFGDPNKTLAAFQELLAQKKGIEAEIGEQLSWEDPNAKQACRICIYGTGDVYDGAEEQGRHLAWFTDKVVRFDRVFGRRIRDR
jgi:hypothetical protein